MNDIKRWLAIEIGCLECSNETEIIGTYDTEAEAIEACGRAYRSEVEYAEINRRVFDLAAPLVSGDTTK